MTKRKVLINFVFCRPVGHVLEALKVTKDYFEANKDWEIHLLLNAATVYELAEHCPWIEKVHPIDCFEIMSKRSSATCLRKIPIKWDFIITDNRAVNFFGMEEELIDFHKFASTYFKSNIAKDYTYMKSDYYNAETGLCEKLNFKKNSKVNIKLPSSTNSFTKQLEPNKLKITILPLGSAPKTHYPSLASWDKIISELNRNFKKVEIFLTGSIKSSNSRTTTDITTEQISTLTKKYNNVKNYFDIGFWNQVALIKSSDIFLSPHSGFGFISQFVDTPWLILSGGSYPEYLFNRVKFYSVFPKCEQYPCWWNLTSECKNELKSNKHKICMNDNSIAEKISEIIKGAKLLIDNNFTYRKAMQRFNAKRKDNTKFVTFYK